MPLALFYKPSKLRPWLDSNQRPDLAPGILVLHHCTRVLEGGLLYQLSYKDKVVHLRGLEPLTY